MITRTEEIDKNNLEYHDGKYSRITFECHTLGSTHEASDKALLAAIGRMIDIGANNVIHDISVTIAQSAEESVSNNEDPNKDDFVIVDTKWMECVSIHGKSPSTIVELITFLNSVAFINPLMTKDMYERFRKRFTSLYYESFFNDGEKQWSFDTDEINNIMEYRGFRYKIISKKINDKFYWRIIHSDVAEDDNKWDEMLSRYSSEEIREEEPSGLKTELTNYLEVQRGIFPVMDQTIYRIFSTGFKNIFNKYVGEEDQYEKITYKNINNILKMYKLPYILSKDHGSTFIKKCE